MDRYVKTQARFLRACLQVPALPASLSMTVWSEDISVGGMQAAVPVSVPIAQIHCLDVELASLQKVSAGIKIHYVTTLIKAAATPASSHRVKTGLTAISVSHKQIANITANGFQTLMSA